MKKTIIELFAGVGGFRLGFERSSKEWETVWFNQWEPKRKSQWAYDCYLENFGQDKAVNDWNNVDISKVDTKVIPDHTVLVGGFPCQDYSVANTQAEGIKGKKGVLWWEIKRIIEDKKPQFVLLENVNRLLKSPSKQRGRDFGVILACLNNLGYVVEWRVINAADYGFPQRRRRIFIFASKKNNKYTENLENIGIESILYKSAGFFSSTFPVNKDVSDVIDEIKLPIEILEVSNHFKFEFKNSGIMKDGMIYSAKVEAKELPLEKKTTLGQILEQEVDDKYFITDEELSGFKYLKGAKAEKRVAKNGHEYEYREGAVPFPDLLDKSSRTILTSERTKNRSTHIIRDPDTGKLRKLTPVECERLNGFPDNWTETETMSHPFRYFCMGNALVVGVIEKMANKLLEIID